MCTWTMSNLFVCDETENSPIIATRRIMEMKRYAEESCTQPRQRLHEALGNDAFIRSNLAGLTLSLVRGGRHIHPRAHRTAHSDCISRSFRSEICPSRRTRSRLDWQLSLFEDVDAAAAVVMGELERTSPGAQNGTDTPFDAIHTPTIVMMIV